LNRKPVFNWTRNYLTHSLSPTQLPEEKRLALIVHFLPKEIRELL
jgi:protein TonB